MANETYNVKSNTLANIHAANRTDGRVNRLTESGQQMEIRVAPCKNRKSNPECRESEPEGDDDATNPAFYGITTSPSVSGNGEESAGMKPHRFPPSARAKYKKRGCIRFPDPAQKRFRAVRTGVAHGPFGIVVIPHLQREGGGDLSPGDEY